MTYRVSITTAWHGSRVDSTWSKAELLDVAKDAALGVGMSDFAHKQFAQAVVAVMSKDTENQKKDRTAALAAWRDHNKFTERTLSYQNQERIELKRRMENAENMLKMLLAKPITGRKAARNYLKDIGK